MNMKMKHIKINSPEDLTEENLAVFQKELDAIKQQNAYRRTLRERKKRPHFNSIEDYMKYYNAIPFDEFDKKFRL